MPKFKAMLLPAKCEPPCFLRSFTWEPFGNIEYPETFFEARTVGEIGGKVIRFAKERSEGKPVACVVTILTGRKPRNFDKCFRGGQFFNMTPAEEAAA